MKDSGTKAVKAKYLEQRVRGRLEDLRLAGLHRKPRPAVGVDFCSNDYLGLATHPSLKKQMAEAVLLEGCGATGSRLLRGERECFSALERQFAAFKATDASLYFGSGYLANLAVLTTFLEEGDIVFSDSVNHASLIDGLRLSKARRVIFPHGDVSALQRLLETESSSGNRFVVTESLFSMDGDQAPLKEYAALCRASGAELIVDEAHAVGIYGTRGTGLIEATEIGDDVFLSINTAGKALGVGGAFVAGPSWAVEYMIQRARPFIFSTAPPPPMIAAIDAALKLVRSEPDRRTRLLENASLLRSLLANAGIPVPDHNSQIIPVIFGDNVTTTSAATSLSDAGFDVRGIRPPTVPPETARLRVTVNSNLEEGVIRSFASALIDVWTKQRCKVSS